MKFSVWLQHTGSQPQSVEVEATGFADAVTQALTQFDLTGIDQDAVAINVRLEAAPSASA